MKTNKRQRTYQTRNKAVVEAKEPPATPPEPAPAPSIVEEAELDDLPDESKLVIDLGEETPAEENLKLPTPVEADCEHEKPTSDETQNKNDDNVRVQVESDRHLIKQIYEKTKKRVNIEVCFSLEDLIKSSNIYKYLFFRIKML